MMKLEVKEKLIKALRSGEYKQTVGQLKSGDCFCVNGVLCDLAIKDGIGQWYDDSWGDNGYGKKSVLLPIEVAQWASDCSIKRDKYSDTLLIDRESAMGENDTGKTFNELADMLEQCQNITFEYRDQ